MERETVQTSVILGENGFIDVSVDNVGLVTFTQRSTKEVLFAVSIYDLSYIYENAEDAFVDMGGVFNE